MRSRHRGPDSAHGGRLRRSVPFHDRHSGCLRRHLGRRQRQEYFPAGGRQGLPAGTGSGASALERGDARREAERPQRSRHAAAAAGEGHPAETRRDPGRGGRRLRRRKEEHPRRRVSAGVDAARDHAVGAAGWAQGRTARAEGHRSGSRRKGRGHRSGYQRVLQRQPRAVQHPGRGVSHRSAGGDAGARGAADQPPGGRCHHAGTGGGQDPGACWIA